MEAVAALYLREGDRIVDATYGRGVMWRNLPSHDVVRHDVAANGSDATNLHSEQDQSTDVFVFDPPFAAGNLSAWWMRSAYQARYRQHEGKGNRHKALLAIYQRTLGEAWRILRRGGVAIIKCQDEVAHGHNQFTHLEIMLIARATGYTVEDLAVIVQHGRPPISRGKQRSLRKRHSYILVLRKPMRIRYSDTFLDRAALAINREELAEFSCRRGSLAARSRGKLPERG